MHKITNNSIKNRGSNLILNKSGRGPPKKHQHQICQIIGLRDGQNGLNKDR